MEDRADQPPTPEERTALRRCGRRVALGTAVALVLAVYAGVFFLYWVPITKILWGDEVFYRASADRLLGAGHADLDLLWPPLYPHFVAGLLVVGGGSLVAVQVAQAALLLVVALLLRDCTATLTGSRQAGWVAALFLATDPTMAAFATYLWPEVLHVFLFVAVWWVLLHRRGNRPWLVAAGVALGLALLTKSLLGPFVPVLLLPLLSGGSVRRGLASAATVLGVASLVVAPVVVANGVHRGAWVVSDSSRFNLWVGLNDDSRKSFVREIAGTEYGTYVESAGDFGGRQRVLAEKVTAFLHERPLLGVLREQLGRQYFRLFDKDSFLTDQLPGGLLHEAGSGYRQPPAWLTPTVRSASLVHYVFLLLAAAAGLVVFTPRRERAWLGVVVTFFAYNLVVFLLLHVKSRYRLQFVPFLDLFAGAALAGLWTHVSGGDPTPISRRRVAGGLALGLLLLFLAFGGGLFAD